MTLVPVAMGNKRDATKDIVKDIILETGYAKKHVEDVVNSFLANFQERISDGSVYIKGFGEMIGFMETKKYFDINQRAMDEKTQPVVRFKPTNSFLRLVKISQENRGENKVQEGGEMRE